MIFEQTAQPTRALAGVSAERAGAIPARSTSLRTQLTSVAGNVMTRTIALLQAFAACGNPSYFELERTGPVQQQLGPWVSRESDSFWPISQW